MSEWLAQIQLERLYSHAIAAQRWPELGFVDKAAGQLLRIVCPNDQPPGVRATPLAVVRSRALDEHCRRFLAQAPEGLVINVAGGLSTRFHRLSQQLDWPRFHWLELDNPSVARAQQSYLPRTDHYRTVGASSTRWSEQIAQVLQAWCGPVLIVAESPAAWLTGGEWQRLLQLVGRRPRTTQCELVYDYLSPMARLQAKLWHALLAKLYPRVNFVNPTVPPPWQLIRQTDLRCAVSGRLWGHWRVAHLVVG
ncbi:hypothetical protein [Gilvimarinus agarilyticus]|uniref:hypothetical protein n=1 Tax=Gilvimarinus agarilyticus TaxID=679259 RepID=UPI0005A1902B|nr:hypothetical protein [Gilvimarinus agarilyticus]